MHKQVITARLLIPFLLFYGLLSYHVQAANEKEERDWQDESIYLIMVDRFNNGNLKNDQDVNASDANAYHGGDLQGITKRLDYIQNMGFTTILLTPVVDNEDGGYHGEWTQDFYKVDEHFGSMEDLQNLVDEAHKRGMKVMFDFVLTHTGPHHPWLQDAEKQDWYREKRGASQLPALNHENKEVQTFLIDNAKWWIQQTDVDGFRLTSLKQISESFLSEFIGEVKTMKKNFFIMGDAGHEDINDISRYEAAGVESFLNKPYYDEVTKAFQVTEQSQEKLYETWVKNQEIYKNPYVLSSFLDNLETKRFTRLALEHKQYPPTRLRLALAHMFTSPGIPMVYYGTEIALDGGEVPDNRRLMDFKTNDDFLKYISKLGQLRQQLPALRHGTFELLYEKDGMSVSKRVYGEETIVIAVNNTNETQKVHLTPEQLDVNKELRGLLKEDIVRPASGGYYLVLDRESANVYALADRTGLNLPFISAVVGINVLFVMFLVLVKKRRKQQ